MLTGSTDLCCGEGAEGRRYLLCWGESVSTPFVIEDGVAYKLSTRGGLGVGA